MDARHIIIWTFRHFPNFFLRCIRAEEVGAEESMSATSSIPFVLAP